MPLRRILPWLGSLVLHSVIAVFPVGLRSAGGLLPPGSGLDFTFAQPFPGERQAPPAAPAVSVPLKSTTAVTAVPQKDTVDISPAPQPEYTDPLGAVADANPGDSPKSDPLGSPRDGVSAEIGWESVERRLLGGQTMAFPKILSATGREAECEARIMVSALGTVTKVEIVKSSGYTEIDASVKSVLGGYVFSRNFDPGTQFAVGIVKFRFRLEKLD